MDAKAERLQFVRDSRERLVTFTELCALHDISRITGYKWLHRAEQSGLDSLEEPSRRPHSPAGELAMVTARKKAALHEHLHSVAIQPSRAPDCFTL